MPITEDRADFFWLDANDPVTAMLPEPETYQSSKITPLIDMDEYVDKLNAALATVGVNADPNQNQGDFIYIAGWWLGLLGGPMTEPTPGFDSTGYSFQDIPAFNLDATDPTNAKMIDVLKTKSRRGVDVRVLGWISYAIMGRTVHPLLWAFPPLQTAVANSLQAKNAGIASIARVNAHTLNSIKGLREEPTLAKKCQLNILGHSAGAVHVKGCVVGTTLSSGNTQAIAFTGGLDFEGGRWADFGHEPNAAMLAAPHPPWAQTVPTPYWHDVQAAIEGPAAQGFYNFFLQMWNENLARDVQDFRFEGDRVASRVTGTPSLQPKTIDTSPLAPPPAELTHHVQSLRTIPAFNYHWYNCLPEGRAASFAPNGRFEYRAALEKAISNAERYIYVEDQSFSSRQIMEWINARIATQPNLRVILVKPGTGDPNDAPSDTSAIDYEVFARGLLGINAGGGSSVSLNATQRNQVRVFRVWGESLPVHDSNGAAWGGTIQSVDTSVVGETRVTLVGLVAGPEKDLPKDVILLDRDHSAHFLQTPAGNRRILGSLPTAKNQPIVIRLGATGPAPAAGNTVIFWRTFGITVHSKIVLIDDRWALIGSANSMRRSLYTDWEHSVSFLDENETAVGAFRERIWAEHFKPPGTPATPAAFDDLDTAIGAWDPGDAAWKTTPTTPSKPARAAGDLGPDYIQTVPLAEPGDPEVEFDDDTKGQYDGYLDPDSRDDWGYLCSP